MDETIQSTAIDNAPGYVQMFPRFIAIAILIIAVVILLILRPEELKIYPSQQLELKKQKLLNNI